ncbi:MAG: hypothetical protein GXY58_10760 [Planctomycetaceae bacterium]|nr:hypothetical protein [Planctomycetaceae bacterium]
MCQDNEYVCGSDLTPADVADFDDGRLIPWRRDASGQWYRRVIQAPAGFPTIQAVPPQAAASASDSDVFDEPAGLDDFERSQLRQWADELRRGGGDDPEEADE